MFDISQKALSPLARHRRHALNLILVVTITFCLFLLNILVLYTQQVQQFFHGISRIPITNVLINLVFFLVAIALIMSFLRFRRGENKRTELEAVLSSISPDALIIVDPDRNILMCNASVLRIFGYTSEELLGQKTDQLYLDRRSSKNENQEIYETLKKKGFHIGIATGLRKGGGSVPLEIISAELSHREGAVLLLRDITERTRAQEERVRLEATTRQRQKLESLGVLAGGIAHDFNNLLAGILGNAELACGVPDVDPTRQESLREIIKATQQAAGLCREMLACAGKGKWHVESLDLSSTIKVASHILKVAAAQRHTLEYNLGESLPTVDGDGSQIQQVVHNLVRNAAEAIGDKEGLIVISTGVMQCNAAYMAATVSEDQPAPGDYVFIRVSDNGCGMDEQTRVRAFEPFFTTKYGQRGLGLASVCGIVQNHHGTVHVESQPERGAIFTVLLPRSGQKQGSVATTPYPPLFSEQTAIEWKGQGTVLVVEDEEAIRRFVEHVLRSAGLTVYGASDGAKGFALFQKHASEIDVALLDLNLPHLGGEDIWAAMMRLRPDLKVLVTSGNRPDHAQWIAGVAGFVQKPFDVVTILEAVRKALES